MLTKKKRKTASQKPKKRTNRDKIISLIKLIIYYQQLIQSSILSIQNYKTLGILDKSEIHNNIEKMEFFIGLLMIMYMQNFFLIFTFLELLYLQRISNTRKNISTVETSCLDSIMMFLVHRIYQDIK